MTLTWWFVYAVGLVVHVGGIAMPLLRADPSEPQRFSMGSEGRPLHWMAVSAVGVALLFLAAGMGTEGILATGAVVGSGVAAGVVAERLLVRRHNARLGSAVEP